MPRRTYKWKPQKIAVLPKRVKALEKKVYKIQKRVEPKYIALVATQAHNFNGTIFSQLNTISQGTSDTAQRIGDRINLKSIKVNYEVKENTGVGSFGATFVRLIVFIDKEVNLTLGADILTNTGTGFAPIGHYQWDNSRNFMILKDKKFALCTSKPNYVGSFKVNLKDIPVQFDGGTTTILKNDLKIMWIADTNLGTDNPTCLHSSRIEYYDS